MIRLLIVIFVALQPVHSWSKHYEISHIDTTLLTEISIQVMKTAYTKLGHTTHFYELPARRSVTEANAGSYDAELHRIDGIQERYTNLIKLPEPINHFSVHLITKNPDTQIRGLGDLDAFTIGTVRGVFLYDQLLRGFDARFVGEIDQALQMLESGRVDLVMTTDIDWSELKHQEEYRDLIMLYPPLETIKLFHYVHRDNEDLLAPLNDVITEMRNRGELDKIRSDLMEELGHH